MAHEYTTWAYQQKLTSSTKFVLVVIADRANHEGFCWPSRKDIAERTGLNERSVTRAINELKEKGLIAVKEQRRKDGYKTNNLYQLILSDSVSGDTESCDRLSGDNDDNSQGTQCPDNNLPTVSNKPSIKLSRVKSGQFEKFWSEYPRKVKKKLAKQRYETALETVSHQEIMDGLKKYKSGKPDYADWRHASTWLNDEGWNDEYEPKGNNNGNTRYSKPKSNAELADDALAEHIADIRAEAGICEEAGATSDNSPPELRHLS